MASSKVFRPFRALGLCSSDVSFAVKYKPRNKEFNVAVPVGERFNVYMVPNLRLIGISDCLPSDIRAFSAGKAFIYAAAGNVIYAFRGLRHVEYKLCGHNEPIIGLLTYSSNYLASYDEAGMIIVWDLSVKKQILQENLPVDTFALSVMIHPSNYGGKLLLGSLQAPLRLWNSLTGKLVYWFKGFDSGVTCLAQSPAKDVCAIGLADGNIILHNIRYDISLAKMAAKDTGAITAIDFRSATSGLSNPENLQNADFETVVDSLADIFLVVGSAEGQLLSWKLESDGACRAVSQTEEMHLARVVNIFCVPTGESSGAVVSSGADNCLKVSYFDRPDGGPRTAYSRSGHFLPPKKLAFWTGGTAGGNLLISGGSDSQLRIFSTFNERFDKNLGRAYAPGVPSRKKAKSAYARAAWLLPEASCIALSCGRAYDWDSMAVAHTGRRQVSTWNFVKVTRGQHFLDPAKFHGRGGEALRMYKNTIATDLCMTRCGNFVVIGYSSGDVIKFNIQSGREYGSFGDPIAHTSTVVGVFVNIVNRVLITVGETDIKFWKFAECSLISSMKLDDRARFARFQDESDTLAVCMSSGEIVLLNAVSHGVFRRFPNSPAHPCIDLVFSSDASLMITAHRGDSLIKTWDIIDCKLVDVFRVSHPVTSLAFSPADDLLATTHANCLGVYLWDNRATYERLHLTPLPFNYIPPQDEALVTLPTRSLASSAGILLDDEKIPIDMAEPSFSDEEMEDREPNTDHSKTSVYLSPDQLQDKLATLSGLPGSYFKTFLQLDAIKQRNADAISAPDQQLIELPFFLPVAETTTGLAWIDDVVERNDTSASSRNKKNSITVIKRRRGKKQMATDEIIEGHLDSVLADINRKQLTDELSDEAIRRLKQLNPSALDMEIRRLAPAPDELSALISLSESTSISGTLERLCTFLCILVHRFEHNLDIDFAAACLENVLRRHGELIARPLKYLTQSTAESGQECDFGAAVAGKITPLDALHSDVNRPLALVEKAMEAKRASQTTLYSQITRSIALVDFVRNATSTLQM